ncbi:hypothetical protein E2542_SST17974 [Spatholobus suberectus]|nr:hypothetical protein E2542_SST17974 [Spatholobus suberectus]
MQRSVELVQKERETKVFLFHRVGTRNIASYTLSVQSKHTTTQVSAVPVYRDTVQEQNVSHFKADHIH